MNRTIFTTIIAACALSLMSFDRNPLPKPKNPPQLSTDTITRSSSESVVGAFTMDEKGTLVGSFTSTYKGLARNRERSRYTQDNNRSNYVATMIPFENVKVDSFGLNNLDAPEQPLSRLVYCKIPLKIAQMNDLRHFETPLQTHFLCNPLAIPSSRGGKYDLAFEVKNQYTISIDIPDGYEIGAIPEKQVVNMPNSNSNVEFESSVKKNTLTFNFKMTLVPGTYKGKEFNQFKDLVETILAKKYEAIVLRKKSGWGGLPEYQEF